MADETTKKLTIKLTGDASSLKEVLSGVKVDMDEVGQKATEASDEAASATKRLAEGFVAASKAARVATFDMVESLNLVNEKAEALAGKIGGLEETFKGLGATVAFVAGTAALGALGLALTKSIEIAQEGQVVEANLRNAYAATGQSLDQYEEQITSAVTAMAAFGHTGEDTRTAIAELTRAGASQTVIFSQMGTIADFAAVKHESLAQATDDLMRATKGGGRELVGLGIGLTAARANVLATLHPMERLPLILKLIEEHSRGAAQAQSQTLVGAQASLNASLNNLLDTIGTAFLPALTQMTEMFAAFVNVIAAHQDILKGVAIVVGVLLTGAIVAATRAMIGFTISALANPFVLITLAIVGLVAAVAYLMTHWTQLQDQIDRLWRNLQGPLFQAFGLILALFTGNLAQAFTLITRLVTRLWGAMWDLVKAPWDILVNLLGLSTAQDEIAQLTEPENKIITPIIGPTEGGGEEPTLPPIPVPIDPILPPTAGGMMAPIPVSADTTEMVKDIDAVATTHIATVQTEAVLTGENSTAQASADIDKVASKPRTAHVAVEAEKTGATGTVAASTEIDAVASKPRTAIINVLTRGVAAANLALSGILTGVFAVQAVSDIAVNVHAETPDLKGWFSGLLDFFKQHTLEAVLDMTMIAFGATTTIPLVIKVLGTLLGPLAKIAKTWPIIITLNEAVDAAIIPAIGTILGLLGAIAVPALIAVSVVGGIAALVAIATHLQDIAHWLEDIFNFGHQTIKVQPNPLPAPPPAATPGAVGHTVGLNQDYTVTVHQKTQIDPIPPSKPVEVPVKATPNPLSVPVVPTPSPLLVPLIPGKLAITKTPELDFPVPVVVPGVIKINQTPVAQTASAALAPQRGGNRDANDGGNTYIPDAASIPQSTFDKAAAAIQERMKEALIDKAHILHGAGGEEAQQITQGMRDHAKTDQTVLDHINDFVMIIHDAIVNHPGLAATGMGIVKTILDGMFGGGGGTSSGGSSGGGGSPGGGTPTPVPTPAPSPVSTPVPVPGKTKLGEKPKVWTTQDTLDLQKELDNLLKGAGGVVQAFSNAGATLAQSLLSGMSGALATVTGAGGKVMSGIGTVTNAIWTGLASGIGNYASQTQTFVKAIPGAAGAILDWFTSGIKQVWKPAAIATTIFGIIASAIGLVGSLLSDAGSLLSNPFGMSTAHADELPDKQAAAQKAAVQKSQQSFLDVGHAILEAIGKGMGDASAMANKWKDIPGAWAHKLWDMVDGEAGALFPTVGHAILDRVKNGIADLVHLVTSWKDAISGWFATLLFLVESINWANLGVVIVSAISQGLADAWNTMVVKNLNGMIHNLPFGMGNGVSIPTWTTAANNLNVFSNAPSVSASGNSITINGLTISGVQDPAAFQAWATNLANQSARH